MQSLNMYGLQQLVLSPNMSAYKIFCAAPARHTYAELWRWMGCTVFFVFLVCFETVLFVSVVSIQVRNTEANRNKLKNVLGFMKHTETVSVSVCLGSKQNFVCLF
jgi:hypothetical protein